MAKLTTDERKEVRHDCTYKVADMPEHTKPELLAVVDKIDDWVEDNQASFVAAFPATPVLTATQKVAVLKYVIDKRLTR